MIQIKWMLSSFLAGCVSCFPVTQPRGRGERAEKTILPDVRLGSCCWKWMKQMKQEEKYASKFHPAQCETFPVIDICLLSHLHHFIFPLHLFKGTDGSLAHAVSPKVHKWRYVLLCKSLTSDCFWVHFVILYYVSIYLFSCKPWIWCHFTPTSLYLFYSFVV